MAGAMIDLIHCVSVSIGTTHEWSNKVNKKKRQDVDELLFSLFFSPIYQLKKKWNKTKMLLLLIYTGSARVTLPRPMNNIESSNYVR